MSDNVNHPKHYTGFSNGAEVIDITENLSFNLGNVVKYVARAGRKTDDPVEDLRKAKFYLEREIRRISGLPEGPTPVIPAVVGEHDTRGLGLRHTFERLRTIQGEACLNG